MLLPLVPRSTLRWPARSFARCLALGGLLAIAGPPLAAQAPAALPPSPPVPTDPALRTGTLPNGLRYYIRHNATPAGRVDLALVVNAGSILEDDDQRGLAHFVEHMEFGGSTHFPGHRMIDYIESVGMVFGNDLNASTGYDETVYSLTMPTQPAVLDTALLILADWTHAATFDAAEITRQRGIIFEERRLDQGPQVQQLDRHNTFLLGARYGARDAIGLGETILHAPRATILRFYQDWYRPDLETVVMVGDIDVAAMEAKVIATFRPIPRATSPRVRPPIRVLVSDTTVASVMADASVTGYSAELVFPQPDRDAVMTEAAVRQRVVRQLFESVLNTRLTALAATPDAPIRSANLGEQILGRYVPAFDLTVQAQEPTTLERGITAVMATVAQVARDGVTPQELAQAQTQLVEQTTADAVAGRPRSNQALLQDIVRSALEDRPVLDPGAVARLTLRFTPTITPAELHEVAQALVATRGTMVLADVPKDDPYGRPSESVLVAALQDGIAHPRPAPPALAATGSGLAAALPAALATAHGRIVRQRVLPRLGITEWTLSNGARVLVKPTSLATDAVTVSAVSQGGTSVASDQDYPNAAVASTLVQRSGLGPYDQATLDRRLTGLVRGWSTTIGADSVTASVQGSPRHAAALFQLLALAFTAPRLDSAAVAKWRTDARRQTMSGAQVALLKASTQRNPRARPVLGPLADSVDAQAALAFYRASFADAGHFTFVIVGDVTLAALRPLVEQYLGGLPGQPGGARYQSRDVGIRPPAGIVRRKVVGTDSMSTTVVQFSAAMPATHQTPVVLEALRIVLWRRVLHRLREQLNGVYSPAVSCWLEPLPYGHAIARVQFTSAPERVPELERALFAVLDTFTTQGVTPAEVQYVHTLLLRTREVQAQRVGYWTTLLTTAGLTGESLDDLGAWEQQVATVTAAMLNQAGRQLVTPQRYVEVMVLPVRLVPMQRDDMISEQQW